MEWDGDGGALKSSKEGVPCSVAVRGACVQGLLELRARWGGRGRGSSLTS